MLFMSQCPPLDMLLFVSPGPKALCDALMPADTWISSPWLGPFNRVQDDADGHLLSALFPEILYQYHPLTLSLEFFTLFISLVLSSPSIN